MKKITACIFAFALLLMCVGCGSETEPENPACIIAAYSIKSTDKDFIVEVQDLGGVYDELYDKNGIVIKFRGGEDKIFDDKGNPLSRETLNAGDTLKIDYDGTLAKSDPKTIKAYKVTVIA